MKKIPVFATILFVIFLCQGCSFPQPYPIEDTQNILVAGIDIDGDDIILTVLADSIKQTDEAGNSQIENELYDAKGKTILKPKEICILTQK